MASLLQQLASFMLQAQSSPTFKEWHHGTFSEQMSFLLLKLRLQVETLLVLALQVIQVFQYLLALVCWVIAIEPQLQDFLALVTVFIILYFATP